MFHNILNIKHILSFLLAFLVLMNILSSCPEIFMAADASGSF